MATPLIPGVMCPLANETPALPDMHPERFIAGLASTLRVVGGIFMFSSAVSAATGVLIGPLLAIVPWEEDPYRITSLIGLAGGAILFRLGSALASRREWVRRTIEILFWLTLAGGVAQTLLFAIPDLRSLSSAHEPEALRGVYFFLFVDAILLTLWFLVVGWLLLRLRSSAVRTLFVLTTHPADEGVRE